MAGPDFSGTWRFNPSKSTLQISPPDESTFEVDHREPALRLSRTHVSGGRRDTLVISLTIGGAPTVMDRGDVQVRARAFWEGNVLAFDSSVTRGGITGTNEVRYRMAADGLSFEAHERFRSRELNYENVWWMDRSAGVIV